MLLFESDVKNEENELENKEISKRRNVLRKFLQERGEFVKDSDILPTRSWNIGEFSVDKRIYQVDDIKQVVYGDDWFKYHEYKDYGKYRVSIGYHFFGLTNEYRSLSIACETVYVWSPRIANYKKKTNAQMDRIVASYVDEYIKNGCPGNADIDILSSAIKYELSKLYLKRWFEY